MIFAAFINSVSRGVSCGARGAGNAAIGHAACGGRRGVPARSARLSGGVRRQDNFIAPGNLFYSWTR